MITATERALKLATSDMKIVPGHGPLGDKPSLTRWYDMISAVRDRVQKQKADGKTLPEVVNAKPTAEFDSGAETVLSNPTSLSLLSIQLMSGRARSMSSTFVIFSRQKLSSVPSGCATRWFNRNRFAPTNGIEHTA